MSVTKKLLEASGGGGDPAYVDDVFSTYLYEGTGSTQTITNGIDLDGEGGLVWIKSREQTERHWWVDTERGVNYGLDSSDTIGQVNLTSVNAFNSNGFSVTGVNDIWNGSGQDFASWTFAKQKGFFDIVTYTGNGGTSQTINHNLGSTPGMVIVKRTNGSSTWNVWQKDVFADSSSGRLLLNESSAAGNSNGAFNSTAPTDAVFTVGSSSDVNNNNSEYVAYLFADDAQEFGPDGDESIIKFGKINTGNYDTEIDIGWEPQWLLVKCITSSSDWRIIDNMRGSTNTQQQSLRANLSDAEISIGTVVEFTSRGFIQKVAYGQTFIYMAIRRPNKPAEEFEPDELFAMQQNSSASTPAWVAGFPVDFAWNKQITGSNNNFSSARLMAQKYLSLNTTSAQGSVASYTFDYSEGWNENINLSNWQSWMFRRAPGFFDVVTYTGNGVAGRQIPHNLGVAPEMMWVKNRDSAKNWFVYSDSLGPNSRMYLNDSGAASSSAYVWNNTSPTDTVFTIHGASDVNGTGNAVVAYLWASVPGICDIGSYTGTGADRDIDCGFTNGARFVLIRKTSGGDDWVYFDTLRGINANSPMLKLNEPSAQSLGFTYVQPYAGGFKLNGAGLVNGSGNEYIYMAIA